MNINKKDTTALAYVVTALLFLVSLAAINLWQVEISRIARTIGIHERVVQAAFLPAGGAPLDGGPSTYGSRSYITIEFDFRPGDTSGNPNLFQTGAVNSGMRAEISGDTVGFVRADKNVPAGLRGGPIAGEIEVGSWRHLALKALNESFIRIQISGSPAYSTWGPVAEVAMDHILVGQGFSEDRRFKGEIRNARITIGRARPESVGAGAVTALKALSVVGFILALLRFAKTSGEIGVVRFASSGRLYDPLLLLRAFACLLVVFGHGLMITHRSANLVDQLDKGNPFWLLTASPWGGVWIFFVLSGYLMGKVFIYGKYTPDQAGIWNFYRNRLLRIAPMYWTSVLVVAALVYPELLYPENYGTLAHILLFDYDGEAKINPIGALWSIGTEMQFYLFVPIIYMLVRKHMTSTVVVAAGMIITIAWGLAFRMGTLSAFGWDLWPREVYKTLAGNIDLFLIGFLTNYLVLELRPRLKIPHGVAAGFAILTITYIGLAYASSRGMLMNLPDWRDGLLETGPTVVGLLTSAIIVCFELGVVGAPTTLTKIVKMGEVFGLMTYAIYVWHEPILLSASSHIGSIPNLHAAVGDFAAALLVVLIISTGMYVFIERPFDKKKRYARQPEQS